MFLSVIVPVYHVEATLNHCVQSILDACIRLRDIEVILVDDGSDDGCPAMCDEWAQQERCIKVVHKTNGGLSDARNAGIAISTGDYITFVDSDDYIEAGTYDSLHPILMEHPEYDILEYPVMKDDALLQWGERVFTNPIDYWLEGEAYTHSYACNKVYRRALFESVSFPVGMVFEDVHTLPRLLALNPVVATTTRGRYHYITNPNGITGKATIHERAQLLDAHVRVLETLTAMGNDVTATAAFYRYYLHVVNIQLTVPHEVKICTMRVPPVGYGNLTMTLKVLALNTIGIKNLCRLYRLRYR